MTQITLLDGGMGQELLNRSGDMPTNLWATQVMLDHPGLVQAIHGDYFAAGATVATSNTYAVHHDRFAGTDFAPRFDEILAIALAAVRTARDDHGSGRIAGAIGPLIASYRPDIHPDSERAVPLYAELARAMAPHVDLILGETVASLAHADAILTACAPLGVPVWLAVTVRDSDGAKLRSGEHVGDVIAVAHGRAAALLANCSAPEAMPAAIDALLPGDVPVGCYANAFTQITEDFLKEKPTVDALSARRDMGPQTYADHAMDWITQGATIVGGCCETGPAHIAELARRIRAAGHSII
ncbi:homocysteine S-methyltransferase family protein [Oceaniglobus ichthyenteri]|uniref:homocysteine S-methyltransferase family protein n=1 Tax=Oceaniglobus ichthyenteri TaxID=2136177 RepID=UPI000D36F8D8|nr:homocysteine S-methyltransferase family protein [Oceaniglobus ichthyenteri]